MNRRAVITLLGGTAAWPLAARAQQAAGKIFRIGYIGTLAANSLPKLPEAFRAGLGDLGYEEGRNIVIEFRWADGHYERLLALFLELIRLNVDVIVTYGTAGGLAAKQATTTIPIVFATAADAVASGLVASLAQPGGNVTGTTHFIPELSAKQLELLKAAIPGLTDVAVLLNPANPMYEPVVPAMRLTAQSLKLELHQFGVRGPSEFEGAFEAMAAKRVGALVVMDDATLKPTPSAMTRKPASMATWCRRASSTRPRSCGPHCRTPPPSRVCSFHGGDGRRGAEEAESSDAGRSRRGHGRHGLLRHSTDYLEQRRPGHALAFLPISLSALALASDCLRQTPNEWL
jgi:putative tryptophan/tyrosine transport system substrate-binding protein